jgi:hypothetical protein
MDDQKEQRGVTIATAVFGLLTFISMPITMVFYFVAVDENDIPSVSNVLARTLVSVLSLLFVVIFFAGLARTLRNLTDGFNYLVSLMCTIVYIWAATALVAHSLEAGGVLNPSGDAVDATQDGVLAQGNYLLYGSIGRVLMTAFMTIAFVVTLKTKILPRWTAYLALGIAILNAAFIPSMFFGTNANRFYSAIGWGNSAVAASAFVWWVLAVSVVLLIRVGSHKRAASNP